MNRLLIVVCFAAVLAGAAVCYAMMHTDHDDGMQDEEGGDDVDDIVDDKDIWVTINGRKLRMDPADNPSASAFRGMLAQGPVTVHMSHFGGFEIVGPLGADLPRSDSSITTSPGDVILYQGNQVTIYYDENTWSFTMLGHIQGVTQSELKDIIGSGDVDVVFSLERGIRHIGIGRSDRSAVRQDAGR